MEKAIYPEFEILFKDQNLICNFKAQPQLNII